MDKISSLCSDGTGVDGRVGPRSTTVPPDSPDLPSWIGSGGVLGPELTRRFGFFTTVRHRCRRSSSPPSDTKSREISRSPEAGQEPTEREISSSTEGPVQGVGTGPAGSARTDRGDTVQDMKGNTNGIAAVRQRERLIATLQPLPPEAAVELTPSLLTLSLIHI